MNEFPSLDESIQTVSGQAELLASICICAEQTFTEASAKEQGFAQAFPIALEAYVKSTARDEANNAIKVLFEGMARLDRFPLEQLEDIIKNHHLRINADTA